jgi:hypothetical protein
LLSVDLHILERNDKLSELLGLGNRQESLQFGMAKICFMTKTCCTAKRDVTRRMYTVRYRNVYGALPECFNNSRCICRMAFLRTF